jgi:methionyl aminopeptidase
MIITKSAQEIEQMARAGEILVETMRLLERMLRPGVTTAQLDQAAERFIRSAGATPAFKGYRGFPGSICTSPNSLVVHGIPGAYELTRGDLLSIDTGVTYEGWVADAAQTFAVGSVSPTARKLQSTTRAALMLGVEQCHPGNRVGDISHAIQQHVEDEGLSIIRSLVGHGVGRSMHEDPQVPNFGSPGKGVLLSPGMVLAIEPMVAVGHHEVRVDEDQWAIYTQDGSLAAHFEFTVAIEPDGPRILTPWHKDDVLERKQSE